MVVTTNFNATPRSLLPACKFMRESIIIHIDINTEGEKVLIYAYTYAVVGIVGMPGISAPLMLQNMMS